MQPVSVTYRADIDGLRAISVLLVLLFHGFPAVVPGGYIGVDVFLAISGYLITGQIFTQLGANSFSFSNFYARRIRRIFPPLIAVLAFVAIYGYCRLNLADFNMLYRQIAAATVFISNFTLWQEAGYFDQQSELKPLLHLWSLAIEEQFYVLWPILLVVASAVARRIRNAVAWMLLLVCIASFAMLIHLAVTDSVAAFYSPLARFWELGAGGLLAVAQIRRNKPAIKFGARTRNIAATLSCLCLVGCAFAFSQRMPVPGLMNALPVLCALTIIAVGSTTTINHQLLASKPFVQLGLVSYSLYLWHWPLLAFMRIEGAGRDSPALTIALLVASGVLAFVTRALLEQPLRRRRARSTPVLLAAAFACSGVTAILYAKGYLQPPRLAKQAQIQEQVRAAFRDYSADGIPRQDCASLAPPQSTLLKQSCVIWGRADAAHTVVVWGDSMSWAWMPPFITLVRDQGWRVVLFSHTGCAPLTGVYRTDIDGNCSTPALRDQIMETIRTLRPDVTFLIARWNLYYHGHIKNDILVEKSFITDAPGLATAASAKIAFEHHLPDTVKQLAAIGRVVVFRDTPVLKVPVDVGMANRPDTFEPRYDEQVRFEADINRIIDEAVASTPQAKAFDPARRFCDASKCSAYLDGLPAYVDEVHLTPHAVLKFVPDIWFLGAIQ